MLSFSSLLCKTDNCILFKIFALYQSFFEDVLICHSKMEKKPNYYYYFHYAVKNFPPKKGYYNCGI